jgi:hypothetical protein
MQQYMNSDQGAYQIKQLANLDYLKDVTLFCSVTMRLLDQYAFKEHNKLAETKIESPKVRNAPLKAYFSLAYYVC